jgi:hypothetical protein
MSTLSSAIPPVLDSPAPAVESPSSAPEPPAAPAAPAPAPSAPEPVAAASEPTPPAAHVPPVFPPHAPAPHISRWEQHLKAFAAAFYEWLIRPRVRLTATGVLLLLIGGVFVTSSVWTLPLVIVGALMVLIAWIGSRLDGQFGVEWGEGGTQVQFRAKIKSAAPTVPALIHAAPAPVASATPEAEPQDAEVIEGEAHTVEIDVAELKALIAAAEAEETGQRERAKVAALRLARTPH